MTLPVGFKGRALPLGPDDISLVAGELNCTIAIVHAFSDIESAGSGFLPDGRLKILAEARVFHMQTGGRFDDTDPNISSPVWDRSLYGAGGAHQWDRFERMYNLAPEAALKSCSIGRFQVMGFNHKMVGFASVEDLWTAFADSERAHLDAFGEFIRAGGCVDEMQADPPDFVNLALFYNGAGERANGYDQKLEVTYYHYVSLGEGVVPTLSVLAPDARTENPTAPPLPSKGPVTRRYLRVGMTGPDVVLLQQKLGGLKIDGRFGKLTRDAVEAYEIANHLAPVDGVAGPLVQAKLFTP